MKHHRLERATTAGHQQVPISGMTRTCTLATAGMPRAKRRPRSQHDEGDYNQTLSRWNTTGYWNGQTHNILSISDSTSAAIDFVLFKAWNSPFTPIWTTTQEMCNWINSIRPIDNNSDYETWLGFLANSYNGQTWDSPGWEATKNSYRTNTATVYSAMGGDSYWYGTPPPPQSNNASVSIGAFGFRMPGQIKRVSVNASNTGTTTWSGGGSSSMYRLASQSGSSVVFSAFPQCGGYYNSNADARIYTCSSVAPGTTYTYQLDARAPTSGTSSTLTVRMIQDAVGLFGNTTSSTVGIGTAYCGTAVTQCILNARPDILPFYQNNGWPTSCSNRDSIVNNWCGIDPTACNNLKSGPCAAFNNSCRCSGGSHLGGISIDPNGTFCGYKVCGGDHHIYECQAGWVFSATTCN